MSPPDSCRLPRPALDLAPWRERLAILDREPAGYRELLKSLKELTFEGFERGDYIDDLIKDTSRAIDALLTHSWNRFGFGDEAGLALLAVGGYGREELHPASDIDILILLDRAGDSELDERLSTWITFLWDTGLDIGQSVRTVEECYREGKSDVTVATNLFESRLITGNEALREQLQQVLDRPDFWPSREFFSAKLDELKRRHSRFADSSYRLEPNLKESPGGLRDLHTLAWITKRHFGVATLRELIDRDFINQDEYNTLCGSRDFLWRVRFGLHRLGRRKDDRVLLDLQRPLARLLGYDADNEIQAVEEMMQDYYRSVTNIARISEMLLQHFEEEILLSDEPAEIVRLNDRFQLRNGFLEVTHSRVFEEHPPAMLELFLMLQQHAEARGIRAATIRLIRNSVRLIDDDFRNDPVCHKLFLDLLRRPRGIYHDFRRMNAYGILAAYIPAFADIVGRMQFDMFHIYTVDEHTLMVLRFVRRLSTPEHADEVPQATELFQTLRKPKLLYLAALFHDIGKGRGGDHSVLGAVDAEAFCKLHGLAPEDTELVTWLVRTHLLMSMIAQRKDITDVDVIEAFAREVKTVERLTNLYLLTISDIRGTNLELWNGWRASLLSSLYNRTRQWLESAGAGSPEESQVALVLDTRRLAMSMLTREGWKPAEIEAVWRDMHDEYFQRHEADTVRWHTELLLKRGDELPIVDVQPETDHGATDVVIYTRVDPVLFSLITSVLEQLNLNIVDARVYTTRGGMALDTFSVLDESGGACDDPYRLDQLREKLEAALANPEHDFTPAPVKLTRRHKSFDVPLTISFENPPNKPYSVLQVSALDQRGLLANIAAALYATGTRTLLAKIATIGERAEDVLYVTTAERTPLSAAQQRVLEEKLREMIGE